MKDAPVGRTKGSILKTPRRFAQFASVNAIDRRGEDQNNGKHGTDEHSSLRATLRQPTKSGGDNDTKALMATAARRVQLNRGRNSKQVETSLRRSKIATIFRRTKGASIQSQRVVPARATQPKRVVVSGVSIATERVC